MSTPTFIDEPPPERALPAEQIDRIETPASTFRLQADHRPPGISSLFLRSMLLLFSGTMIWAAWVNYELIRYTLAVINGTYVSQADYFANGEPIEELAAALPSAMNGSYLFAAIAYLCFVYAAAGNLEESRATRFKRSAEGAVAVSFIPLANFVLIYKVMRDIWVSSLDPVHGVERPTDLLPFWWMTFLIGALGGRFADAATGRAMDAGNIGAAIACAWLAIAAMLVSAASSLLLLAIVTRITRAQSRWKSLARDAQPQAAPQAVSA